MSLSSSQSRNEDEGSASNLDMRYLAAFSLPLVLGNTSACPRLKAAVMPSGRPARALCTSSMVFLPYTFSLHAETRVRPATVSGDDADAVGSRGCMARMVACKSVHPSPESRE